MTVERSTLGQDMRQSTGGYDMVLAVVLLSLLGLWVDKRYDTVPVFTIVFAALALVGSTLNVYYRYKRQMEIFDAESAARRGVKPANSDGGVS